MNELAIAFLFGGKNEAIESQHFRPRCLRAIALAALLAVAAGRTAHATTYTDFGMFQAAVGPLTVDEFELAPWTPFGAKPMPTVNLGVSWTAQDELFTSTAAARSGNHSISDIDGNEDLDQLFAALPPGINAVGGWVHGFRQGTPTALLAYSANNVLLESATVSDPGIEFAFVGVTTTQPIARIEWRKPPTAGANDDFVLDDFVFGLVPEPGSLMLAFFAVPAIATTRRPNRRRQ